ncbi:phage tail tip lysozyme [Manganibacter manganicus]|uniref:Phage tail lysozyme domain-containing protein n=1 Tax=Manganibacter manganicus TaxID=1873176 RepID=A0A1V8RTJ5_9HYPH|nr:phage tail tip lysozyme [Pseudaminobacter manganicus]OQM76458.1 hypothetical protein BFN67_13810 [Pseudaminobacter manganicus]
MIPIRYPTLPDAVDYKGIMKATNDGYEAGRNWRNEKEAPQTLAKLYGINLPPQPPSLMDRLSDGLSNLFGGGQQANKPLMLSDLGDKFDTDPPQSNIQRSPLPAPMDPATARVEQAFAAQGQGRNQPLSSNQIAGRFLKAIRDGGVTNPYALAAIAATGKAESGFDPKNAAGTWSDPSQSGQAGTAGGIMSWRGPRLQALQAFAKQNGDNPNAPSPQTQGKFLLAEDPGLIQKLQQARSPEEAQQLMNNAWRYAGYDQPGGETAERMASANSYAQQFGGSPSQQGLEGLAVGQSMPMGSGGPVRVADASGSMYPQDGMPVGTVPSLPDGETMRKLFANPITRPYAIEAAKSRRAALQDQNDPMKRVEYQTAVEKLNQLRNPQVKPTDDMREYELARDQGYNGSFQNYMLDMKRAGATSVNVNSGDSAWNKESAKLQAKRYDDISRQAGNAQDMLSMYDLAEQALTSGVRTGFGAETELNLRQLGASMGIDTDPDKLAGGELIRSIQNRMALLMRSPSGGMGMPGALSDRDIKFLKDAQIGLDRSPEGNRKMLEAYRAMEQRKIEIAQLADQYVQDHGKLDAGFNQDVRNYAKANPLFPEQPQGSGATRGSGGATGRQRARNPQTGETVEWDGNQWRPVQ